MIVIEEDRELEMALDHEQGLLNELDFEQEEYDRELEWELSHSSHR